MDSYEQHCKNAAESFIKKFNINTYHQELNNNTILGKLPLGRIIEIFGGPRIGKSTLVLGLIADLQSKGHNIMLIDTDDMLISANYAENMGVNLRNLCIFNPRTLEEAFGGMQQIIREGVVDYVFVDSVASLVPEAFESQSHLLFEHLTELVTLISKTRTSVIFINSIAKDIITRRENTTGGDALRYYSSLRYFLTEIKKMKHDYDEHYATRVFVKIVKNLIDNNLDSKKLDIIFGREIKEYKERGS